MRIVADADILSVRECFSELGELELVDGRQINSRQLRNADALLVRSITKVDERLLSDSAVRFVGTATSGTDHVDAEYLQDRGIQFSHAGGCNANAVTEYCFAALALLARQRGWSPKGKVFSLIGAGHVGGLLARKLRALDFQCMAFDPVIDASRQAQLEACGVEFVGYRDALQADLVSFHVPLIRSGRHPTYHQLSMNDIRNLPRDCVLLNTSRGPVIANADLKQVLTERNDIAVALDVWEEEPCLDPALLELVSLGTPHIAGYSVEAKLNATNGLLTGFCKFFRVSLPDVTKPDVTKTDVTKPEVTGAGNDLQQLNFEERQWDHDDSFCSSLILKALPVDQIDKDLRARIAGNSGQGAATFDLLRRQLAGRHEFSSYQLAGENLSIEQQRLMQVLGFSVSRH